MQDLGAPVLSVDWTEVLNFFLEKFFGILFFNVFYGRDLSTNATLNDYSFLNISFRCFDIRDFCPQISFVLSLIFWDNFCIIYFNPFPISFFYFFLLFRTVQKYLLLVVTKMFVYGIYNQTQLLLLDNTMIVLNLAIG